MFIKNLIRFLPSFIKVILLKRKGKIGKNCKLQFGSYIFADKLDIGEDFKLSFFSSIETKDLKIGNQVRISYFTLVKALKRIELKSESYIYPHTNIGGGQTADSELELGKKSQIFSFCFINTTKKVTIEDEVGIGGSCYLFTHGSWQNAYDGFPYSFGDITIKKGAWLPWRVFVMPGITIGEYATIGSDALITKDIPSRSFAVGVPAKIIKQGNDYIKEMGVDNKFELMHKIFDSFRIDEIFFRKESLNLYIENSTLKLIYSNKYEIIYSLVPISINNGLLVTEFPVGQSAQINIFDLNNKTSLHPLDSVQERFKLYLTNFGIRLYTHGKYASHD